MKHIVAFSGGKDSTALVLWALENLPQFDALFCDTGWEHALTYAYIEEINQRFLGGRLLVVKSKRWDGMVQLVTDKGRIPSVKARFCTEKLKVIPMAEYRQTVEDEVTIYQGIRAAESPSRAKMPRREWVDTYDAWVERPLFDWTGEQVLAYLAEKDVKPNPLYLLGARRVGCFPCIMVTHGELKRLTRTRPEVWDRIAELERAAGRSFFPPNYIPKRFQTGHDSKSGKAFPTAADVRAYIDSKDGALFAHESAPSCMSVFNLCE